MYELHPVFAEILNKATKPRRMDTNGSWRPVDAEEVLQRLENKWGSAPTVEATDYETDEPGLIITVEASPESVFGPSRFPFRGLVAGRHDFDITRDGTCFARRADARLFTCRLIQPVAKPTLAEQATAQINSLKAQGVRGEDLARLESLIGQMAKA